MALSLPVDTNVVRVFGFNPGINKAMCPIIRCRTRMVSHLQIPVL